MVRTKSSCRADEIDLHRTNHLLGYFIGTFSETEQRYNNAGKKNGRTEIEIVGHKINSRL